MGVTDLGREYCELVALELEFVPTRERTRLALLRAQGVEQVHTLSWSALSLVLQLISLFPTSNAGLEALLLSCKRSCLTFIIWLL